jgi:ribose transport system permease protein/putative xylitol transport system permease protein
MVNQGVRQIQPKTQDPSAAAERPAVSSRQQSSRRQISAAAIAPWLALIAMIIVFTALNGRFFTIGNAINILQQAAVLVVLSVGGTFIILMGSIDLAVGSMVSLAGMSAAMLIRDHGEWAVILVPFITMLFSAIAGVLFAYGRLPSFLTTLGMLYAINGITLYVTQGAAINLPTDLVIASIFNGNLLGVPNVALWAIGIAVAATFVARRTRFGRFIYAIGGGETVAKLCGVPVARYKLYAFMVSGFLAGVAGIFLMLRIGGSDPTMGDPMLLPAIAAVVMGGTPLTGGVGGPHRTILGVLIITILQNGMNLANVNPFLQNVVLGAGVIAAVAVNMDRKRLIFVK